MSRTTASTIFDRTRPAAATSAWGCPRCGSADGPRGVASNHSTSFPVAIARGASWDVDLEERVGDAIGIELRALGANFYGAPCINLLRHPAWGRAQETYGEDPYHLGEMGAALVRGVQRHNVIATAKHFAANSIENSRFKVDVQMDENVLRAVYLPHFRRVVDEGVASIMSAYNKVNGEYCGHNARLLHDILKNEWGFEGFVHSDFVKGIYGPEAVVCGLDIENPMPIHFGQTLIDAVADRRVGQNDIDEAVCRILTTIYRFQTRPDPQEYPKTLVASQQHRDLAREVAEKSAVLLRNQGSPQPLLPLDRDAIGRLAVIGALADQDNQGDMGSSRVRPPSVVTPLAGLQAYLENSVDIVFEDGNNLPRAAAAAAAADVAVIVVGLTPDDEGEFIPGDMTLGEVDDDTGPGTDSNVENPGGSGGDRDRLTLGEKQEALVCAVAEANPNTIVVLVGGSAIILERWHRQVSAILMLWYPGMEGGSALARLLFGDANPSGKLPFTIPRHPDDLPFFDKNADSIRYDLHHGYTLLDRDGVEPAYPFGFGLGYSRFAYTDTQIDIDGEHVFALTTVANRGVRDGREVVQVYARPVSEQLCEYPHAAVRLRRCPGCSGRPRSRPACLSRPRPSSHVGSGLPLLAGQRPPGRCPPEECSRRGHGCRRNRRRPRVLRLGVRRSHDAASPRRRAGHPVGKRRGRYNVTGTLPRPVVVWFLCGLCVTPPT